MAGNGVQGFYGDGRQATNAGLNWPSGVVADTLGNLFIADSGNRRIRKVAANDIITTVAGGGSHELGDGGPATSATLSNPFGVAMDTSGNLFVSDTGDSRIRKLTPFGTASTLSLNNLTTNDAGNYQVIVSSPYGSVTSSVAAVTVVLPRKI